MPEPTMASKAGCIIFGAHGSDTAAAGIRQIWTGQDTAALTQRGAVKLAETMQAGPEMANNIGLSVDLGVSFGVAGMVKAMRVSHVAMGRFRVMEHEGTSLHGPGGHTFRKHIGRTEAQLRERLRLEPRREIVSSFPDIATAEWAISRVLQLNESKIKLWAESQKGSIWLSLKEDVGREVGYGVSREGGQLMKLRKVRVTLKREAYNGMPYYVMTSYVER
jgi:hypothetical protein